MKLVLLTALGVGGATLIGSLIGFIFKNFSHKFSDIVLSFAAGVMLAAAVLGLILLFVFCLKLKWLPSSGADSIIHFIMPALAISIPPAAQNFRFTKSSMLEAIRQDYVRTARAKGVPEKDVIWKHVLKNALLPVVTQVGLSLGSLICGAVVAEKLFSVPGIGSLIVERITYKDEPIIIAGTILISICFTLVMLLVDIIYAFIDPRIRAKYTNKR